VTGQEVALRLSAPEELTVREDGTVVVEHGVAEMDVQA
jgi:hypothetical protein